MFRDESEFWSEVDMGQIPVMDGVYAAFAAADTHSPDQTCACADCGLKVQRAAEVAVEGLTAVCAGCFMRRLQIKQAAQAKGFRLGL